MVAWPSGNQYVPLISSLSETPPDNVLRSSTDKGPDKVRRRTTANVRPLSFRLILKKPDLATFDTFYDTTLLSGSIEFDYTHPRTKAACKAMFAQPPSYSERGGVVYEVAVSLEIQP
jgi:hypothetical protein